MISPIPHSPITIIFAIIRKDYVNGDSMLRIGEMWRKQMNIKKIVCITALASLAMTGTAFAGTWKGEKGKIRINGGMITATEAILQTAGSGSMETMMASQSAITSIRMAICSPPQLRRMALL